MRPLLVSNRNVFTWPSRHGVLKDLDTTQYDVVVVSPRNYFLFTPLLPGVTTGSVEARSISEPIRRIIVRVGTNIRSYTQPLAGRSAGKRWSHSIGDLICLECFCGNFRAERRPDSWRPR